LTLQDRTFNADGTFSYPVGAFTAPYPAGYPHNWAPESFGDTAIVNGKAFPNLDVERGLYRFRVLNASNARFYHLSFNQPGAAIYQIGTDGGLLNEPVPLTRLRLAPAERADLLIDFRGVTPGTRLKLTNDAVAPYPSGAPTAAQGGNPLPDIMQFTVTHATGFHGPIPNHLRGGVNQPPTLPTLHPVNTRTIMLNEIADPLQPVHVMTNNQSYADGTGMKPRTTGIETPMLNTVEEWDIVNTTQDAHPIHLHMTQFQLLNRQQFDVTAYTAAVNRRLAANGVAGPGLPDASAAGYGPRPELSSARFVHGTPTAPTADESGWKDTIVAMPGYVTRIIVPFGGTAAGIPAPFTGDKPDALVQHFIGTYVLHCHILEHEDNDMMQPYKITHP
jgi:FtsP/CotA-like multicopper oxidase with cupredoxin domain